VLHVGRRFTGLEAHCGLPPFGTPGASYTLMGVLRGVQALALALGLAGCEHYWDSAYGAACHYAAFPYNDFGDGLDDGYPPAHYRAWQDCYGRDPRDRGPFPDRELERIEPHREMEASAETRPRRLVPYRDAPESPS
jgi:hypothetical protein